MCDVMNVIVLSGFTRQTQTKQMDNLIKPSHSALNEPCAFPTDHHIRCTNLFVHYDTGTSRCTHMWCEISHSSIVYAFNCFVLMSVKGAKFLELCTM